MGQSRYEQAATALLVVAAISMAGAVVYRNIIAPVGTVDPDGVPAATQVDGWREFDRHGFRLSGSDQSPIRLTVFADLECPACQAWHDDLDALSAQYGDSLALTYLMFPLSYHKFARSAADARACVESAGGNLRGWIKAVYTKQDSLGLRSWQQYASDIADSISPSLEACLTNLPASPKVDSSLQLAKDLEIDATPTILVNGWKFRPFRNAAHLDSTIRAVMEQRR